MPAGHSHIPALQPMVPGGQILPHTPQFMASVIKSAPLQGAPLELELELEELLLDEVVLLELDEEDDVDEPLLELLLWEPPPPDVSLSVSSEHEAAAVKKPAENNAIARVCQVSR